MGNQTSFLFFLVFLLALWYPSQCDDEQDVNYHFTKMKQKIDDIKHSLKSSDVTVTHTIVKRGTRRNRIENADDLVLSSFASYCRNFNSDPDISNYLEQKAKKEPLSKRDITGYTRFINHNATPAGKSSFEAFPIKFLIGRENDGKVWIIFEIVHSSSANVFRIGYKGVDEVFLPFPESACQIIVSKARFVLSEWDCRKREQFRIIPGTDENTNAVNVYINICESLPKDKKSAIVTKKLAIPFFGLQSPPTLENKFDNSVFPQNESETGNSTTFDIDLPRSSYDALNIGMILRDRNSNDVFQESVDILPGMPNNIESYNDHKLLTVTADTTDSKCDLSPSNLEIATQKYCMRIRVTVGEIQGRSLSGHVIFREYPRLSNENKDATTNLEVAVPIFRPEWNRQTLPSDFIYFALKKRFRCNEYGNMDHKMNGFGKKCILQCEAFGSDISLIYITMSRGSDNQSRFQSGSYVLPDMASAILDVGALDEDDYANVEGNYDCTVVNKRGQTKTQSLTLYTTMMTKVNNVELSINGQKTATIVCSAEGDETLDFSISVSASEINEFVDGTKHKLNKLNISSDNTEIIKTETGKTLKVNVPLEELRLPIIINTLFCEATSDRGTDEGVIDLRNYAEINHGLLPRVLFVSEPVKALRNGSALATCKFNGQRPLEVILSTENYYSGAKVLLRRVVTTGSGTETVVLKRVLSPKDRDHVWDDRYNSHLVCVAKNKYGDHRKEFRDAFYHVLP